jgi:catechol 2,3-dioxygenase-like lactoylglutathione lyase family enzyme
MSTFAKLNHIGITSENYSLIGRFYETMFDMKTSPNNRPGRAVTVGDGYVGLNINPRRAGKQARLDHFGIEVADVETVFERLRKNYPRVKWQQRPASRPFAGVSTHDPDGNVFDLSQQGMKNRRDMYVENKGAHTRHIDHFAIRTMNADAIAAFYRDVFELEVRNKAAGDCNHYLTDGHITMVIMQWDVTDSAGGSMYGPGMDHIGFTVEDVEAFKNDVTQAVGDNPRLAPFPIAPGPEGQAKLDLFQRSCPLCQYHFADPDGVLVSVAAH